MMDFDIFDGPIGMPESVRRAGLAFSYAIDEGDLDAACAAYNRIIKWYPKS